MPMASFRSLNAPMNQAAEETEPKLQLWAELVRTLNEVGKPVTLGKAELRAAVAAASDWMDSHMADFDAALPESARKELSQAQKAWLLILTIERRYLEGA